MTNLQLFQRVLEVEHTQIIEESASFFVEREGDTLRILFEESRGKKDWINNFRFLAIPTKPYADMKVLWFAHRGFFRVWKVIEPRLIPHISDPNVARIEIAGYSHGGALALLCFEYCKYHRPDVAVMGIGFGAPRVMWGPVPKEIKERMADFCVIRNGNDLVTHLPPLLFGYRQLGKMEKIGKSVGPIKDHYPQVYIEALKTTDKD